MKEYELKNLRRRREKHFLQKDGSIIAKVYDDDVHFLKDGKYENIDNTLIKSGYYYRNKHNEFNVYYNEANQYLTQIRKGEHYLDVRLSGVNKLSLKKDGELIVYDNALPNINFKYAVVGNKIKEIIELIERPAINKISFIIETDLSLSIKDNYIEAKNDLKNIFIIDKAYMYDKNNEFNYNIYYNLEKIKSNIYELDLILDDDWLNNCKYPVIIDPTISSQTNENSVYDTYIFPGDDGINKNNYDVLKAGVEKVDNEYITNRALLKFDLPKIGTGSQIIKAELNLIGYPILGYSQSTGIVNIHQITAPWDEETASWRDMHDKFKPRIEGSIESVSSEYWPYTEEELRVFSCSEDITNMVRKWYAGEENYGIMLKSNKEVYTNDNYPRFFSKNNIIVGYNPKPLLIITYRNQNGLEKYMEYQTQSFTKGSAYVNVYNGNLTTVFNLVSTINSELPASLTLYYNTNDVILNKDCGFGKGYKLNFNQTIKESDIENYLEYMDEDGTLHYFRNYEGNYEDEDGLQMTITRNGNEYILKDKNNSNMKFLINDNVGYLTEIVDTNGNKIVITYDNQKRIIKVTDSLEQSINVSYSDSEIKFTSNFGNASVELSNGKPSSISDYNGVTSFIYNENDIVTEISDDSDKKIVYDYYPQVPYRIKRVSEYGLNNVAGAYYDIEYNYNSTTIIDHKKRVKTLTFNNFGNVASISSLNSKENIKDAYGRFEQYGSEYEGIAGTETKFKNKLLNLEACYKYVKNYFENTSFENDDIKFSVSNNLTALVTNEEAFFGSKSLKIESSLPGEFLFQNIEVPKNKNYTFSAYLKNKNNIRLALAYYDINNKLVERISDSITINNEFERFDVTINYPAEALSDLIVKIYIDTIGTCYVDCIQLEEGEVANNYNLIDNSDFSNGIIDWDLDAREHNGLDEIDTSNLFDIVTLENGTKALHLKMFPENATSFSKTFAISGKAGDTYNVSFWYKNTGFLGYNEPGPRSNNVIIRFNYNDQEFGHCAFPSTAFNPNENEWQYFSASFIAERDFKSMYLSFFQDFNANDLYVTNVSLIKDLGNVSYEYDENGNLKAYSGADKVLNNYEYDKNNQIIKSSSGGNLNARYEYDKTITDRMIKQLRQSGIYFETKYNNNKVSTTKISNKGINGSLINGLYKIRLKGTDKSIKFYQTNAIIEEDRCNHYLWILEKHENDYKIKHPILNKYLLIDNQKVSLDNNGSLFSIKQTLCDSFLIKDIASEKYLYNDNNTVGLSTYIDNNDDFEFYFETVSNDLFIEDNIEYTDDGRFVKSRVDSRLNKVNYEFDEVTGLQKTVTNANNVKTTYEYNNKKQISRISTGNRSFNYTYNNNNLVESIESENGKYKFDYDEFLNIKEIKIGDGQKLIANNYEDRNGMLSSVMYGNGHTQKYEYDEFDRVDNLITMDNVYRYKYGNNGELRKIISNSDIYKFNYDLAKRLNELICNNIKVKYAYNQLGNIVEKEYYIDKEKYNVGYTLNSDERVIKVTFENTEVNYNYDYLGRIINQNINGEVNINYKYITNGKRTSLLVKEIQIKDEIYSYKYDKLSNITHVYLNGNLINRYYYNEYNELIEEYNYTFNQKIQYSYDNYGNILSKTLYNLNTGLEINADKYSYENKEWLDQLTKFNEESIVYDEIGNPIQIGDRHLSWINGRQLKSFNDASNNISYKYDMNNIRVSKIVNGIETKYFVENNKVIFETTDNSKIYYLYNNDELIGLRYNGEVYYYVKNLQNDIIALLDEKYNVVAKYTYDSWGNIISVTDSDGIDISLTENHIANINPFRYRGYYYDKETNLYYLKTRYYSPKLMRFINADGIIGANPDIICNNLYTYCSNNPILKSDENGEGIFSILASGFVFGVILQLINDVVTSVTKLKPTFSSPEKYIGAGIGGMVYTAGTFYSEFKPYEVGFLSSVASSAVTQILEDATDRKKIQDPKKFAITVAAEGAVGALSSAFNPSIPGVNSRRYSDKAIFHIAATRLRKGSYKHVSMHVIYRGFKAYLADNVFPIGLNGIRGYFDSTYEEDFGNPDVLWCPC